MGKRELAVQIVLMVEKNIRMRSAEAGRICAAAFSDIFINVYPTICEAFFKHIRIIFTENGKRFKNGLFCLFKVYFNSSIRNDGSVNIVHMQFVHAEKFFAECNVLIHLVEICMNRFDKICINAYRNFRHVKRSFKRRGILACTGKETKLLELCVKSGRNGVLKLAHTFIKRFERVLTQFYVRAFEKRNKRAVRQMMNISLSVNNIVKRQIGVAERASYSVGSVRHFTCSSKKLFTLVGKNVRRSSSYLIKASSVCFKFGFIFIKAVENFFVYCHYFRRCE